MECSSNAKFYVYLHIRNDTNRPFYVGKGSGVRAYVKSGRNSHWQRIVKKHGYSVEILFENLEEFEALCIEKQVIQELNYFEYELANKNEGGTGVSGRGHSEETRLKMSKSHTGRKRTPEEIEKSRQSRIGMPRSKEHARKLALANTGKRRTEEQRKKRSELFKLNPPVFDKNEYIFYSKDDVFIGTRCELTRAIGQDNSRFLRNLFAKIPAKTAKGWSLLRIGELILLQQLINKEIKNDHCN